MSKTRGITSDVRKPNEFYRTPEWATRALLWKIAGGPKTILDAGAGDGAITKVLRAKFPLSEIVAVEINPAHGDALALTKSHVVIDDYLFWRPEEKLDICVMNPPFKGPNGEDFLLEFVRKARKECMVVCSMARLNWLASQRREPFFNDSLVENKPYVIVLPRRPMFTLNKKGKLGSDGCEYAWMVWGLPDMGGRFDIMPIERCQDE